MPRAFGKRDRSVTDPEWAHECGFRHLPGSPCPQPGIWIIASQCGRCRPTRRCSAHSGLSLVRSQRKSDQPAETENPAPSGLTDPEREVHDDER